LNVIPKIGLAAISTLGLGFVFGLAILDAVLGSRDQPTIAERLVTWTKRNPWFAAVLAFTLGVLISHFFWPGG
jgi:anaerobic C4-dicarboxylate transporter